MKKYKTVEINNILLLILVMQILASCSTYSAKFSCGDARGANCYTMDAVDQMITNGEIERFNESRFKQRSRIYKVDKNDESINPKTLR